MLMFSKSFSIFSLISFLLLFAACKENKVTETASLDEVKEKMESNPLTPPKMGYTVSMGVIPDLNYKGEGMLIGRVKKAKAGFKAGLQKGDIILKMGGVELSDLVSYTKELGKYQKEDSVDLIIIREDLKQIINVKF